MENVDTAPARTAALVTGVSYLALAIAGMLGFLLIRPTLFVEGDPAGTLANLVAQPGLARAGIALELAVVLAQATAAAGFFVFFRSINTTAAGALAAFGLVNSVLILGSAACLATALSVASDPTIAGEFGGGVVQLLYVLSQHAWTVGGLFFGLWLIPMGYLVLESKSMSRTLGKILIVGGVAYIVSAFTAYLLPQLSVLTDLLAMPATVGEVWMIGYLLRRAMSSERNALAQPLGAG